MFNEANMLEEHLGGGGVVLLAPSSTFAGYTPLPEHHASVLGVVSSGTLEQKPQI